MKESLKSCKNALNRVKGPCPVRDQLFASVGFMQQTLNSLIATYQIILMTINRCTDYTKTSHGIPLFSAMETIHLVDTLMAPISCVRDLQDRVRVEFDVNPSISEYIATDRQWIQDNVLCLISNAVKFSLHGIVTIRVDLDRAKNSSTSPNHLMIRIEVEDNGPGLQSEDSSDFVCNEADETQKAMFIFREPDLTKRRGMGGSGLGLHCLANRIEALGGDYGVSKRKDYKQGCVFWFTIPYQPVENSGSCLQSSPLKDSLSVRNISFELSEDRNRRGSISSILSVTPSSLPSSHVGGDQFEKGSPEAFSPSKKIGSEHLEASFPYLLIVDDSLAIQKMLKIMLERNNFRVTSASNGKEAVEAFLEGINEKINSSQHYPSPQPAFDGILMDLQMPVMDGFEAISRIRDIERLKSEELGYNLHHLIVAMSAGSDEETLKNVYRAGADEFLPKPFNLQSFQRITEEYKKKSSIKTSCK